MVGSEAARGGGIMTAAEFWERFREEEVMWDLLCGKY